MASSLDNISTAPCGMRIRYDVDDNDFVSYNDINGRGEEMKTKKCRECTWVLICNPTVVKEDK